MELNEVIRERRAQLGLSDTEVAAAAGLSIHEYCDVESYSDEATSVLDLSKLKALAKALDLEFFELLDLPRRLHTRTQPRHVLVKAAREGKGLSREELADRLGFYEQAVTDMESDADFLESWSFDLVQGVARELDLNVEDLVL